MGIRRALRLVTDVESSSSSLVDVTGSSSTFADVPSGATSAELPAEVALAFGLAPDLDTITRREAMRVPAVKRGRAVIAGTIGTLPLVDVRGGEVEPRPLLDQPDPNTTRQHVITWTVDDLLFSGIAWWRVTARAADRFPVAAERIALARIGWREVGGRRRVTVDGRPVDDADLIRFDGPDEGVLAHGAGTLRTALAIDARVRQFAENPVPSGALEPVEGITPPSNEPGTSARAIADPDNPDVNQLSEVDDLLDGWHLSRRRNSTAYLAGVRYATHSMDGRSLQLAEQRDRQAVEVGRLMNVAPRYLAAPTGDSMTYSTTESERRDLVDLSLAPYLSAIAGRLSLGDVTPRGHAVRFDLSAFLRGDLAAVGSAITAGVTDAAEGRDWLGLPPRTDLPARPAPTPSEDA